MNEFQGRLPDKDHRIMDEFLSRVLDAYKSGEITKDSAIGGLAHIMAALDKGNTSEAINWFKQEGVSFFKHD